MSKSNYKKVFKDFWGYAENEYIPCTGCNSNSVDIHHLTFKSHCGKDEVCNLAPVCRRCHTKAHDNKVFNELLKISHGDNIERFTKG